MHFLTRGVVFLCRSSRCAALAGQVNSMTPTVKFFQFRHPGALRAERYAQPATNRPVAVVPAAARTALRRVPQLPCLGVLVAVQGGLVPSKISGVGTNFGLLVHVLQGTTKQRALNSSIIWAELGGETISPVASFVLGIHFTKSYFLIRGAHLARSKIENTCLEGLDRTFIKCVDVWT